MQRNHDWYNKNEARAWPLDDAATLVDDTGRFLPSDILADLNLWFPDTVGKRAFVSAVSVSPTLVTLVILSDAVGYPAIATVSLAQPVVPYRQYPLESQVGGAGGWVVFGSHVNDTSEVESFRFSTAEQGLLLARTGQHYIQFPVTGVAKVNTQPKMTGIINLVGGRDIETLKAKRTIHGSLIDVGVIRLKDKTAGTTDRNVSEIYVGDCGKRPESANCGNPQPIEFINEVAPDCCGRLYIEIRGCAELFAISNMNGVILDCLFNLTSACATDLHLPDEEGKLPNEYPDLCDLSVPVVVPPTLPGVQSASFQQIVALMQPDIEATAEGLPFTEKFSKGTAPAFVVDTGGFRFMNRSVLNGTGHGGTIFYMAFQDNDKCYVRCGEEHGLEVSDRFVSLHIVDDKQVAIEHTVDEVENDIALFTTIKKITSHETPPTHGVWARVTGFQVGPDGGGFGTVDRIYPHKGGSWYETDEPNLLTVGSELTMFGNDVSQYNSVQKVVHVDGPDFITTRVSDIAAERSAWLANVPRGGGTVHAIRYGGIGALHIGCTAAHGLLPGDRVVLISTKLRPYLGLYEVQRGTSPEEFAIAGDFIGEDHGAWYLVRSQAQQETVYESEAKTRSVSLWNEGAPQLPNWTCFHKQVSATLRFKPTGAARRLNGGIVFNYKNDEDGRSFVLFEIDVDAGKLLRLWQVKDGTWTVWRQKYIPEFNVDMPYRLTVDILPFSNKESDAMIVARLDAFEQEAQHQLEPVRIQFVPSNGKIGLHANRSRIQFTNFSVRHLE